MSERFVTHDPPRASDLSAVRDATYLQLRTLPVVHAREILGVAGTVTTLAAISLKLHPYDGKRVHGLQLTRSHIQALRTQLVSTNQQERLQIVGLPPKRADVIVAGVVMVDTIMEHFGCQTLVVSDRGLRWGVAQAFFAQQPL